MGAFPGMGGIQARINRPFNEDYRCYSMAMFPGAQRENVDYGGKGMNCHGYQTYFNSHSTSYCTGQTEYPPFSDCSY
jgi:hypothetical protein